MRYSTVQPSESTIILRSYIGRARLASTTVDPIGAKNIDRIAGGTGQPPPKRLAVRYEISVRTGLDTTRRQFAWNYSPVTEVLIHIVPAWTGQPPPKRLAVRYEISVRTGLDTCS